MDLAYVNLKTDIDHLNTLRHIGMDLTKTEVANFIKALENICKSQHQLILLLQEENEDLKKTTDVT